MSVPVGMRSVPGAVATGWASIATVKAGRLIITLKA